ncbi:hypothetical protein CY35_04G058000 [Sphagnum magellanicum]|nr:hypothetical protein CY35_04G058000 [Sphagnum magellanicum]KAH9565056.1 hypothetical protein CY35_04G058000 [Sphagnum magellanicum]KAH9565057.1 hypothetical protein CY35_04G058000 [Sphagnum magellanicum]KAH9565058.1 hypothetical protein CY35_04G058000 [Sphagnum magellanicum]
MNDTRSAKERSSDRKQLRGDVGGITMTATPPPSSSGQPPMRRPSRACSTRLPPRPVPPPAPPTLVMLSKSPVVDKQPRTSARATSLVISPSSASPAWKERYRLRSMWELSAILNFFSVFRPVLKLDPDLSNEEVESALLSPNNRLDNIHVTLLKAIPPASRIALSADTWATVLSKKLKDWWPRVAEGPCPLLPSQGGELAAYKELDVVMRVRLLRALCEIRVDQDDLRIYIDESLKHGHPPSVFRKDRIGCGAEGTMYWYEHDASIGHRLYREIQVAGKSKGKGSGKGRNVPPPLVAMWETVATSFEEFQEVAQRLSSSRNRMEVVMGKRIEQSILPELEEIQKKKERTIKKQQRQAMLLDNSIQGNGLAAGRSRRERKPVTYTFDEYDRSINEAIKFTKKKSPELPLLRRDLRSINNKVNGMSEFNELGHPYSESNGAARHGEVRPRNGGLPRRQLRSSQPAVEFTNASPVFDEAGIIFSDDEIEGEAVYDDEYIAAKLRRESYSSERGKDDRGDEQDDANYSEEEIKVEDSGEEDGTHHHHHHHQQSDSEQGHGKKRKWKGPKVRLVNDIKFKEGHRRKRPIHSLTENVDDESEYEDKFRSDGKMQILQSVAGTRFAGDIEALEGITRQREEDGVSDNDTGSNGSLERVNGRAASSPNDEKPGVQVEVEPEGDYYSDQSDESDGASVAFEDKEENLGQEAGSSKASGKQRQMLDLNEIATGTHRNNHSSSENDEYSDDYSGEGRMANANGDQAGAEAGLNSNRGSSS